MIEVRGGIARLLQQNPGLALKSLRYVKVGGCHKTLMSDIRVGWSCQYDTT